MSIESFITKSHRRLRTKEIEPSLLDQLKEIFDQAESWGPRRKRGVEALRRGRESLDAELDLPRNWASARTHDPGDRQSPYLGDDG